MTLQTGARLGRYEILAPLGRGGMGEVYKARDTRLGRDVAIKVLPQHLTANPELRQRFEREARAICKLQRPRVCTLHDVGSEQGLDYLVMEHLEGETLEARLCRGALPMTQLLELGGQIAEAIDAARRHGLVHRDLEPANVMLTASGAKVLDFGLAREIVPAKSAGRDGAIATLQAPLTEAGMLAGTLPYMAPEQLRGTAADARTDLWGEFLAAAELPFAYHLHGDDERALDAWIRYSALRFPPGETERALRLANEEGGLAQATEAMLDAIGSRFSRACGFQPWQGARMLALAGERDRMFDCLEESLARGQVDQLAKVQPIYDPYRDDPRFLDVLRRLRLTGSLDGGS